MLVPILLLLIARDLLLYDPPRVLAWRFLHDPRLAEVPSWLAFVVPRPPGWIDRDPVALLLGAVAVALALAYLAAALAGAGVRVRAWLIGLAAACLVLIPTIAFITMGHLTQRPYGQDGGVVQLPLALDKILAGESPYGADYSDSILGKQARVSDFWATWGGNPILRHHAYLPGTHLVMLPFYLLGRTVGLFDTRLVTLLAYALAGILAWRLPGGSWRGLAAAASVLLNPLVYWHQTFGANDALPAALILLAVLLAEKSRPVLSGAAMGLACATKQLAWPFAPFLFVHLSGARRFQDLTRGDSLRRAAVPVLAAAAVFVAVVAPVAALGGRAFWGDVVLYNLGLSGDSYPLGGTPGFGFANFLIYGGAVSSLRDQVPLGALYVLLLPLVGLLLRVQMREGGGGLVLAAGSAALLASLYVSRVVHPNYLVMVALLLPVGFLMGIRRSADVAVVPLLLLGLAVEVAEQAVFRGLWEQVSAAGLGHRLHGLTAILWPRSGAGLTEDPFGLLFSALLAGLAVVYLVAGLLRASSAWRSGLVVAALSVGVIVPTLATMWMGAATGTLRGQDPWLAQVASGPEIREAWSVSFRRDPPAPLRREEAAAPGTGVLGHALSVFGLGDPRLFSLLAAALGAALLFKEGPPEGRPLALGALLLCPALAIAVIFGSPAALVVAGFLGACALARRGRPLAAGLILGLVAAVVPRLTLAAPFALAPLWPGRTRLTRALGGFVLGFALLVGAHAALDPAALWSWFRAPETVGPGTGMGNLLLYRGGLGAPAAGWMLTALGVISAVAAALVAWRGGPLWPVALAAGFYLTGLWLAAAASAHELAVPIGLFALSALRAEARSDPEAATG